MEYSEEYRETGSSSDDASRDQAAEKRRSYRINPELDPENDQTNDDTENDNVIEKESKRLPPPPRSAEEMAAQRKIVRSMWELASVFDFISLFNEHVLKLPLEVTADELEMQILTPEIGKVLTEVHYNLLKHIHPPSRPPVDRNNWVTILAKRLTRHWGKLSDGECPLKPADGEERYTYESLSPSDRVRLLKALCELRLDQEDIHQFVDSSLKSRVSIEAFRLQPVGNDASGFLYWFPQSEDGQFGQRLYRESPGIPPQQKGKKVGGRKALPLEPGNWETVASSLPEFQEFSETLIESKSRVEKSLGKYIEEEIIPNLEELERKREKALRRQQRQVLQLQDTWLVQGLVSGRSKRERKNVSYTFDDFDKSIEDAIKVTRKTRSGLAEEPPSTYALKLRSGLGGVSPEKKVESPTEEEENGHLLETGDVNEEEEALISGEREELQKFGEAENGVKEEQQILEGWNAEGEIHGGEESVEGEELEGKLKGDKKEKGKGEIVKREVEEEEEGEEEEEEEGFILEDEDEEFNEMEESEEDDEEFEFGRSRRSLGTSRKALKREESKRVEVIPSRRSARASKLRVNYKRLDGRDFGGSDDDEERPRESLINRMTTRRRGQRQPGRYQEMDSPDENEGVGVMDSLKDEIDFRGIKRKARSWGVTGIRGTNRGGGNLKAGEGKDEEENGVAEDKDVQPDVH